MWLARVRIRVRCRSTCSFVRVPFVCVLFVLVRAYVGLRVFFARVFLLAMVA